MFLLGSPNPAWLAEPGIPPLFVSRARLVGRVEFPRAVNAWCQDSGGFSMIKAHGEWTIGARRYANETRIYSDEIGNMLWAAPQDWMCEPPQLKKTGKTVREHQELTIQSVIDLRSIAPEISWIPVLQGWTKGDYLDHIEMYDRAGFDLPSEPTVGLGSVCRRQGSAEFLSIVRSLVACGLSLHGFGVKTQGLAIAAPLLQSSDSMAWSMEARWLQRPGLPQCIGSKHKNCANCLPYALDWRRRLLEKLPSSWGGPPPIGTQLPLSMEFAHALPAVA